jgi:hypothetical protein
MKDKIKVIEPSGNLPNVQQKDKKLNNDYNRYCLVIFALFIIMTLIVSFISLNEWIKFAVIILGTFILEDIHHTLKRLWEKN